MKKRLFYTIYVVALLLGLHMLFLGMFVRNESIASDVAVRDSAFDLAEQLENHISRNFAFRKNFISAYSTLQQQIFASSPVKDVIVGKNGYLFYAETVNDYCGMDQLNDRELYNIQKTLELISEHVSEAGGQFVFIIAPNKNSLYDYMPNRYIRATGESNAQMLQGCLEGVNTVDLQKLFLQNEEELYFKTDTHWNDKGAYYVYEHVQQALGYESIDFLQKDFTEKKSMVGDLLNMMVPDSAPSEYKLVFQEGKGYEFLTKTRDFEQNYIESFCEEQTNSLLMFRDSFANNLIHYFSESYRFAIYDKAFPYDLTQMEKYDCNVVVAEIAERNLREYLKMAPIMVAPEREIISGTVTDDLCAEFEISTDKFIQVHGTVNAQYASTKTNIYLKMNDWMYELTPVSKDENLYGFTGYVSSADSPAEMSIVVTSGESVWEQVYEYGQ